MQLPLYIAAKTRSSRSARRSPAQPAVAPLHPLAQRGVSQTGTIRAHAARVIAVTALYYDAAASRS